MPDITIPEVNELYTQLLELYSTDSVTPRVREHKVSLCLPTEATCTCWSIICKIHRNHYFNENCKDLQSLLSKEYRTEFNHLKANVGGFA